MFGLVPAALIGVDLAVLLDRARSEWPDSAAACAPARANACVSLGAALGELALAGRDKLTFLVAPPLESLPAWLEQLIAESTGKNDKGIVPVADEPATARPIGTAADRVFVSIAAAGSERQR